jgi:hypothetical protein
MPVSETVNSDQIADNRLKFRLKKMVRQPNGRWFAHVEVDGDVAISDGRSVDCFREVSVGMNQQHGRKKASA